MRCNLPPQLILDDEGGKNKRKGTEIPRKNDNEKDENANVPPPPKKLKKAKSLKTIEMG